jgi:hypothetical protein
MFGCGAALPLAALLLPGCADRVAAPRFTDAASIARAAGEVQASVLWNAHARSLIGERQPSQFAAWRLMAYLGLSQFVAVERVVAEPSPSRARVRGAVAGASVAVLSYQFPADTTRLEGFVAAEAATLPTEQRPAFVEGVAAGRETGARAVARARADNFAAPWTGTVPVGPGFWFSSLVPPAPPVLPRLGEMRPFYLTSGRQFRPGPPPAFGSPSFNEALAEVRRISDTRTPQQDSIAKYWALATGTLVSGFWNTVASELISRTGAGERSAARAFALMSTAAMDALIACHDAKYTYWLLRPIQADPAIRLAVGMPNFPAYPSNHACASGAAAFVLGALWPNESRRLGEMANEAGLSRVYGGIHFRFDSDTGLAMARSIGALAAESDRRNAVLDLLR